MKLFFAIGCFLSFASAAFAGPFSSGDAVAVQVFGTGTDFDALTDLIPWAGGYQFSFSPDVFDRVGYDWSDSTLTLQSATWSQSIDDVQLAEDGTLDLTGAFAGPAVGVPPITLGVAYSTASTGSDFVPYPWGMTGGGVFELASSAAPLPNTVAAAAGLFCLLLIARKLGRRFKSR